MASFHRHTTGEEAAKALSDRIKGRTFVITGASEGSIGASTALALAHGAPKTIILPGRTLSKITPVLEVIKTIDPSIETLFVALDLTDLDSVRTAAKEVLDSGKAEKVHGLINCAGVMLAPYGKTKQGIELHFATNHVGHFLWTNLLLERVLNAKDEHARIVNVSSLGFTLSEVLLDNYNFDDGKTYHPWTAYGASKTANVLFTTYLSSHLKSKNIDCITITPGMFKTALWNNVTPEGPNSFAEAHRLLTIKYGDTPAPFGDADSELKSFEASSSTSVVAVADERLDGKSGVFLANCQELDISPVPYVTDPESAEKLWKLSEQLVGENFDI